MKLVPTIGIEVHVELSTAAKVFSLTKNSFSDEPNKNVNEIDLGYPGTLPKLNEQVVENALKIALALNTKVNKKMFFDRKNYFYVDNPKNFQITQFRTPIGADGYLEIFNDGVKTNVAIEELHIEEDTCKSIHGDSKTYLNYNRAGVPLVEIVTKPVIKNGKEAALYIETLRETLEYLGVSDVKIEEGSMRCDANVSLAPEGSDKLGVKTEIKNIGSISNVVLAIDYEIARQTKMIENGETIFEETRRFDDKTNTTILMRRKETGNDYRYIPEPDIPFVCLEDEYIEEVKAKMPKLPAKLREEYAELGLNNITVNALIKNKSLSLYFNEFLKTKGDVLIAANLLSGDILSYLNKKNLKISETKLTISKFEEIVSKIAKKEISLKMVKDILEELLNTDKAVADILSEKGMSLIGDESEIEEIVDNILDENPDSIEDFKAGKDRAVKYLMGQIMKATKGMVNPGLAKQILETKLKQY